jgi:hypothetical protein
MSLTIATETAAVALAVEGTITTPAPGFGFSRLGDIVAAGFFVANLILHFA